MKYFYILLILLLICCEGSGFIEDILSQTDKINIEKLLENEPTHETEFYNIQVSFDEGINNKQDILTQIDAITASIYDCIYMDSELAFESHEVDYIGCSIIDAVITRKPIDNLTIHVTQNKFFCIDIDRGELVQTDFECAGEYFSGSFDLIIIKQSLSFYGHELAHREGMCFQHENQDDFAEICEDVRRTQIGFGGIDQCLSISGRL